LQEWSGKCAPKVPSLEIVPHLISTMQKVRIMGGVVNRFESCQLNLDTICHRCQKKITPQAKFFKKISHLLLNFMTFHKKKDNQNWYKSAAGENFKNTDKSYTITNYF
jgi:hypothetical protein